MLEWKNSKLFGHAIYDLVNLRIIRILIRVGRLRFKYWFKLIEHELLQESSSWSFESPYFDTK
jgi:hypothetical protein